MFKKGQEFYDPDDPNLKYHYKTDYLNDSYSKKFNNETYLKKTKYRFFTKLLIFSIALVVILFFSILKKNHAKDPQILEPTENEMISFSPVFLPKQNTIQVATTFHNNKDQEEIFEIITTVYDLKDDTRSWLKEIQNEKQVKVPALRQVTIFNELDINDQLKSLILKESNLVLELTVVFPNDVKILREPLIILK